MDKKTERYLNEAIASSEMEGLAVTEEQIELVKKILEGKMTLEEYVETLKSVS